MRLTPYHAKYYAYDLTRKAVAGINRLSMSLFDASVDLNPHQIDAALFALKSPLSNGVLLADEVGLGKTIEAGIVLCQNWAERKRRLLVVCPASLRKQWAFELQEKFNLPAIVLDAKTYRDSLKQGKSPLNQNAIILLSYHYANRIREEVRAVAWDLVVIDEAHKLRNAYRESNKVGQGIRWATDGAKKLLLTATPLQNSLLELYGLSTLIDDHLFGDLNAFKAQYVSAGGNIDALRQRLSTFCKRTLRKDVIEYIRYTERIAITRPFSPTDDEHSLYEAVTEFLQNPNSYAIPQRQRHLTELILRKLLASSSLAIAGTLETMKLRLEAIRDEKLTNEAPSLALELITEEELEDELLDEILNDEDTETDVDIPDVLNRQQLNEEIAVIDKLASWARRIGTDTKTNALMQALQTGFSKMAELGANQKALIFTESRRTQAYLKQYLDAHGYRGKVVEFSGTNNTSEATSIYEQWLITNQGTGRVTGSRDIDIRAALIEYFRDHATILIATEAAAEGVNMQFCSLVVNYDLPWNPQRIEQRIGRCHRYGQQHDVVVINFLNERNQADKRVLELLTEKFKLFNGIFGASDEVLGSIESGVDFEKRILAIYQQCRTHAEIETAFANLQAEMDASIQSRMIDTRQALLENFDEDVHERLKVQLKDAQIQLDKFGKRFWALTKHAIQDYATFDDAELSFNLTKQPSPSIELGRYHLISKNKPEQNLVTQTPNDYGSHLYRLSHPLGELVIQQAKETPLAVVHLQFDVSHHPNRLHLIESLKGQQGYLVLQHLVVQSYEQEDYLLFSGLDANGKALDQETCEKLFSCAGKELGQVHIPADIQQRLQAETSRHIQATISTSLEANNKHFHEARDKLEKWADDMVLAAEKALKDTKEQIKILQRQARQAVNLEEQHELQQKIQKLEKLQRKKRQEIFDVEDEIFQKRDGLISALEKRLSQTTQSNTLLTIQWSVI